MGHIGIDLGKGTTKCACAIAQVRSSRSFAIRPPSSGDGWPTRPRTRRGGDQHGSLPLAVSPSNTSTTFGWWRRRSSVRSASDSRTGLGIGLAFSRWGAEANGGRLYARNLPDQGCVFTVDLPRSSVPAVALV